MSLVSAPSFTTGTAGNLVAASTTVANGTPVTAIFYVGVAGQTGSAGTTNTSSAVGGRVQVWSKGGGAVSSTTNGCLVQVFSTSDGTYYDTLPFGGVNFVIANAVNTQAYQSFDLPPGQYKLSLANNDTTNTITVEATLGTIA